MLSLLLAEESVLQNSENLLLCMQFSAASWLLKDMCQVGFQNSEVEVGSYCPRASEGTQYGQKRFKQKPPGLHLFGSMKKVLKGKQFFA